MGRRMPTDAELMRRMRAGEAGAFDTLFERHGPRVRDRLLRIVRDSAAADDLVQEVFLRLWTRAEQWAGRGPLLGWLLRTATNLALNHRRDTRRRRQQPLRLPPDAEEDDEDTLPGWMVAAASLRPDELAERAEEREAFRGLIDALPAQQREVLRLANEAEMDIADIADELDVPPGTVKSRLFYARRRLARGWQELSNERGDT